MQQFKKLKLLNTPKIPQARYSLQFPR